MRKGTSKTLQPQGFSDNRSGAVTAVLDAGTDLVRRVRQQLQPDTVGSGSEAVANVELARAQAPRG
jgi:hypothetical protein